jgi:hypothetical protein
MHLLYLFGMVEEPSGVFTHVSGGGDKGLKQRPFLRRGCLTVLWCHLVEHFPSGLKTQRSFHSSLLWKPASCELRGGDSERRACLMKNLPLSL